MRIMEVRVGDRLKYINLLLLGDEQMSMIERYLYRGDMFVLTDGGVKSVCIVTEEGKGVYEIKNLATAQEHQGKGYGQKLVSFITEKYREPGAVLYVGTGENPFTLKFYEKCGFMKSHIVKGFFTDNYDHPIYEGGVRLRDMTYLKRKL